VITANVGIAENMEVIIIHEILSKQFANFSVAEGCSTPFLPAAVTRLGGRK
jgi:hypothetical protein